MTNKNWKKARVMVKRKSDGHLLKNRNRRGTTGAGCLSTGIGCPERLWNLPP